MVLKKNIKEHKVVFIYRTITFFGCPFQGHSTNETLSRCSPSETFVSITKAPDDISLQPRTHNLRYILGLGSFLFARRYSGNKNFSLFLRLLGCFTSAGMHSSPYGPSNSTHHRIRFPHSEIPGSKVTRHLTEAYRSHATSFVASISQGIHHPPINHILASN